MNRARERAGVLLALLTALVGEAAALGWQPRDDAQHLALGATRRARIVRSDGKGDPIPLSTRFALDAAPSAWPRAPRHLLLDRARPGIRLTEARTELSAVGTGQGVVIGVVDSGIDALHPELRTPDGASRMAWWIDFGADPYGFYPELEAAYGCHGPVVRCGILGPDEIASAVHGETGAPVLPRDTLGHGTLVASLALGNGAGAPEYAGIAPEAVLIGARVATVGTVVDDLDVLLAARFVFERARDLGLPAVLNLSLGGDMGPHDGRSALEESLGDWLDEPGRAIVVAAGNSGTLSEHDGPYPNPFGIHTDVHVPRGSTVRVPIVLPNVATEEAAIFAWIAIAPGDSLRVAVEERDGTRVLPFVARGQTRSASNGRADATLVHHVATDGSLSDTEHGIALVLSGAFAAGEVFSLLLEGEAVAEMWLQSEGDLAPGSGRGQALFPGATRERTVTVPASSPRLIAVGATLNRTRWRSFGGSVELDAFDPELAFERGSVLPFSSAGPNARGWLKPDVVAPGGVIVGALAEGAEALRDGRPNPASMFGYSPLCRFQGCAQVDDGHGVGIGTSMAAPLVAGAVALLFERDPTLSQERVAALLHAGARRSPDGSRSGAGQLDVEQSFRALASSKAGRRVSQAQSWLSFAQSFARPGATDPLRALVHLRDDEGNVKPVAAEAIAVEIQNGSLESAPVQHAPGLYELAIRVEPGQAGDRLGVQVWVDRARLEARLPIAVDSGALARGASVRGGCAVTRRAEARFSVLGWPCLLLALWVGARHRGRRARVSPD